MERFQRGSTRAAPRAPGCAPVPATVVGRAVRRVFATSPRPQPSERRRPAVAPTAFSRNKPTFRWNETDARVRIGVCSDVHGRHDRLLAVLAAMAAAAVDERWCLGDLVGREPVTAELVGAASQLDLLIAGKHDAWALGPDRVVARGRDVFRLSSRALASRHGIDCWHGSPRHPLLGFLTEASAARILPDRPSGSLGLVGHTHEPALFVYDGAATRAVSRA